MRGEERGSYGSDATVLGLPIAHDETLEVELVLQLSVGVSGTDTEEGERADQTRPFKVLLLAQL